MSSWYDIKIQGFKVFSNSSQFFSEWYFQKADRITREGNEANTDTRRYLYVTDAATVRRRLALQGCDRRLLESEYERAILDIEKEFEYATEYYPDDVAALREAITGMTLDDWLSKLKVIVNEALDRRALHDGYQHADAVINYLTSVGKWSSENRYTPFPCITPDCYTLAVLEVTPDDAEVIMDCTDCVNAGSIAAFDTYIEHLQPRTYFYEILKIRYMTLKTLCILSKLIIRSQNFCFQVLSPHLKHTYQTQ